MTYSEVLISQFDHDENALCTKHCLYIQATVTMVTESTGDLIGETALRSVSDLAYHESDLTTTSIIDSAKIFKEKLRVKWDAKSLPIQMYSCE